jgi:hypothetical protein
MINDSCILIVENIPFTSLYYSEKLFKEAMCDNKMRTSNSLKTRYSTTKVTLKNADAEEKNRHYFFGNHDEIICNSPDKSLMSSS